MNIPNVNDKFSTLEALEEAAQAAAKVQGPNANSAQKLLRLFQQCDYMIKLLKTPDRHLTHLFFPHIEAAKHTAKRYEVLIIDATYKTNVWSRRYGIVVNGVIVNEVVVNGVVANRVVINEVVVNGGVVNGVVVKGVVKGAVSPL
ncbi:hypothetical protein C2G38_2196027 [Gigaspora rosea]|uniref:Uncharacterized protein n=1 Tax=Gigaspora rosea TaxID=44941 RepID=A0A397UVG6_9GLOM|nr:hypothetical protein C2G38_2196027 [Gigaspora rosea]